MRHHWGCTGDHLLFLNGMGVCTHVGSPHHLSTTITHEHPNRPEGQDSRMPLPTPVAVPPGTRMVNTAEAAAQAHPHSNGLLNDLEVLKDKYSLKKSSLHSGIEHIYHQLQRHKQKLRRLLKGQAVETVISWRSVVQGQVQNEGACGAFAANQRTLFPKAVNSSR